MKKFELTFRNVMFACLIAAIVFTIVIVFYVGADPGINTGLNTGTKTNYTVGWTNQYGRGYEITELYNYNKEIYITQPFYLYKTVKNTQNIGDSLYFHSRNLVVNVYLDDAPLYIMNENGDCGKLTAFDNYVSIDLPPDAEGKQLMLEIYKSKFSLGFCIDTFYIGSGQEIMGSVTLESFFPLMSAILFFIFGVGFILLGTFIQKSIENYRAYIFYGIFLVFMAICSMLDNVLAFMTIDNIYFIESRFKIFLIAAMPSFLMFVDEKYELQHCIPARVLIAASAAFTPIAFLLHATGLLPYTSMSVVLHCVTAVFAIVLLEELISFMNKVGSAKLGKEKIDYIAIVVFIFLILFDIGHFYQGNGGKQLAYTRTGLYLLTASITISCFNEVVVLIRYGIKASKIEKIAFTDANTGIGNLAAFKTKFDELERTKTNYKYIAIIQFDVNNLKVINDTKGHEAGDLLIKSAATIINQAFGPIGWCYRTGGDEFVAMTTYNHAPVACDDAINKFEGLIDRFNKRPNKPFDLYIAYGIAYYQGDDISIQNKSLKEIHKIADERMYSKKKELKARYARTPEEAVIR